MTGDPLTQTAYKVELEATARGWWGKPSIADKTRWAIAAHGRRFLVFAPGSIEPLEIDAPEALLLLGLAALPPRVRRCPDCKARGGPMEWCQRCLVSGIYTSDTWMHPDGTTTTTTRPNAPSDAQRDAASVEKYLRSKGWETARVRDDVLIVAIRASRPCPTCTGPVKQADAGSEVVVWKMKGGRPSGRGMEPGAPTGRVSTPWHEVLLGAMARDVLGYGRGKDYDEAKADALWEIEAIGGNPSKATEHDRPMRDGDMLAVTFSALGPGDPQDIADLHALADELQYNGDPLGLALALRLAAAKGEEA